MSKQDDIKRALDALGQIPGDAHQMANSTDFSSRVRAAAAELKRIQMPYDAGQLVDRAKRLADGADHQTGILKGVMLYQAKEDIFAAAALAAI